MAQLVPVDYDPYGGAGPTLVPVDHDPWSSILQTGMRAADAFGGAMMLGPLGALAGYKGVLGDVRNAAANAALAPGRIVQSQTEDAYSGRYNPNDEGQLVSRGVPDAATLAGYATTGGLAAGPVADAATLGTVTRVGPRASIRTGPDVADSGVAANANVSQEAVKAMLPPPKSFMDRIWDNYAQRMTPDEFLQSEPLWSGAHEMSVQQGIPEHAAFSQIANQIFSRMGANRYMTPDVARRYMAGERGIGAVPSQPAQAQPPPSITAYHGSPYDFDRFDLSKIGTGEGAQAYGHGLYFAENPEVAQQYKDTLSLNNKQWFVDGEHVGTYGQNAGPIGNAAARLRQVMSGDGAPTEQDAANAISRLREIAKNNPGLIRDQKEIESSINGLVGRNIEERTPGKTYQVSIAADPEHFLDWDKPLSEQSPKVQEALINAGADPGIQSFHGDQLYRQLGENLQGNAKVQFSADRQPSRLLATDYLRQAGIPGIKYLDQGSRFQPQQVAHLNDQISQLESMLAKDPSRSDVAQALQGRRQELSAMPPTHNYVVFDDRIVDILKKYGIAGLIAGGAAHFSTVPVDHDPWATQ